VIAVHPAERPGSADPIRGRTSVGDFEITVLSDGSYYLDGGAMFGVVPKPLWEKRAPADADNRILLGLNPVIVRTGKQTIAIETGIGNKLSDKLRAIYGAKQQLPDAFVAAGIRPEEIDIVINSHLHFDHCGWNTRRTPEGRVVPTFPECPLLRPSR
jgi:glyoxylase-like metal-dependent hydrolase (beta-lactamase superfamily II)